jgi:exopolysaccharide production protein ExoY
MFVSNDILSNNGTFRAFFFLYKFIQGEKMKQSGKMASIQVKEHEHIRNVSALTVAEPPLIYFILKRCIDIIIALVSIILLLPVFCVIAFCIKIDDHGPVLHFREIVGSHGKHFWALKFRTMIINADTYLQQHPHLMNSYLQNMKLERDPRITRVGSFLRKTSIDELPQLFNVLFGQMSLVGPRIIHPSELSRYGVSAQKRLSVKPGLTGLWQISGRQHVSYEDRIVLDMYYIDHRSLLFDLLILVRTLKVFIIHTGA